MEGLTGRRCAVGWRLAGRRQRILSGEEPWPQKASHKLAISHPRAGRWSVRRGLAIARRRREALDELLRLYLPALRAYSLYRRQIEPDRAEDLLQGFVVRQVLERGLLTKADASRGRFRSFLLKSLQNYVFSELALAGPKEVAIDPDLPGGMLTKYLN